MKQALKSGNPGIIAYLMTLTDNTLPFWVSDHFPLFQKNVVEWLGIYRGAVPEVPPERDADDHALP